MDQAKQNHANLSPKLITSLRVIWLLLFIMLSAVFIAGIPDRFGTLVEICRVEPCVLTLRVEEAQMLADLGLSMPLFAFYHIGIEILVGGIISLLAIFVFSQRFDEPMGILLAFMLILFGLNFMTESDNAFIQNYPQLDNAQSFFASITIIPFLLLIYLFPDGRFIPRWSRIIILLVTIVAIIDPLFLRTNLATTSGQSSYIFIIVILVSMTIGIVTQIYRYRFISTQLQRQQTKWVILGFMALLVPLMGWSLFIELFPLPTGKPRLFLFTIAYGIMASFLMFFPLSFVIAITRYRLWDIDLLIRRTLVYSLLTGTLVLVYFGSVVLVQTAVNAITGQQQTSQLTIALSTLLIAALFNPLRRRVQAFIDRRFYRSSYNAAQTLTDFAKTARDEVDLDRLTAELLRVSAETMQPVQISLWLKPELER